VDVSAWGLLRVGLHADNVPATAAGPAHVHSAPEFGCFLSPIGPRHRAPHRRHSVARRAGALQHQQSDAQKDNRKHAQDNSDTDGCPVNHTRLDPEALKPDAQSTAPRWGFGAMTQGPCRPMERTGPMDLPPARRKVPRFAIRAAATGLFRLVAGYDFQSGLMV
jgi:hypothetical protein